MEVSRQRFEKLDGVIDDLHQTLDRWESNGAFSSELGPETVQLVKLAIHEWVANLVQHADFGEQKPEIILDVYPNGRSVRCVILDNSLGFDAARHLRIRREELEPLPERGMGLLMLDAATDYFEYLRSENGHHKLEFTVSADMDPWLNIPF